MPAKRNFKKDVKEIVGDEYTVEGDYINNKTKIVMIHNICGYHWEVKPAHFLRGSRCPKCSHKIAYNTELFKERVFEIVGDEYEVLGEYVNSRTKIEFKHVRCNYEFEMAPSNFVQGNRCPKCAKLVRYTKQSFSEKVKELVGEEYFVLGEFVNSYTKISMIHNVCKTEFSIIPSSFIQGHRCAKCAGVSKYSTESFKNKVCELVGEDYVVLGDYVNNKTKIRMLHTSCGYEFEIKPNHFVSGSRCPKCSGRQQLTAEIFKTRVMEQTGEEYSVLGDYVNLKTKIKLKHNVCGCVYEVTPSNFLSGHGCPDCYKTIPYTTETFKDKVFELTGDKYTVLEEYKKSDVKIKIRHNICGHEYYVLPSLFIRGNRCPECSVHLRRSLPEEIVAFFVGQYFEIVQGFRPDWLKFPSGHNGEIDIWIPALKVGIEYDGGIHRKEQSLKKDILKNNLIEMSQECTRLYRIREIEVLDMEEGDKINIIKMTERLSLTSLNGKKELSRVINILLKELGINDTEIVVDKKIITICQNRLEEYRHQICLNG